jgi:SPOR domain
MGPNSFRNLTYLAVLAVVGALVYLIYQSSKKKSERLNPSIESLGNYPDSLSSIVGSSTATLPSSAAMPGDTVNDAVDGTLQSPSASRTSLASDVKDVTVNDPGSIVGSSSSSSSTKSTTKPKSPATTSKGTVVTPVKFDAGASKGDYMVIAGAFSSKDNALAQVAKMKKLGFTHAEAVKLENSASTYAIAGYYQFKGGADAAVRTLEANKIKAYAKKKAGEVYKPSSVPAPVKPSTSKPSAPAPKPS